jgi:hypothetical protein
MNIRTCLKISLMLLGVVAVCLAVSSPTFAQGCAMCKATVENSAAAKAQLKAFNLGTIALLLPPVTMMGVILGLAYKRRGTGEDQQEKIDWDSNIENTLS